MAQDGTSPRLFILGGLHAGAECALSARPFTVGADAAADVILHDDGVAPIHLVLEPDGEDLRVVVRAAGVRVADTPLEPGDVVVASLPVSITLAAVELRCEPAETRLAVLPVSDGTVVVRSPTALLPKTVAGRAAGVGLLGLLIAAVFGFRALIGDGAPARAASQLRTREAAAPVPSAAELQRLVGQELASLELRNISLSVDAGIVTAAGHVDPAEAPKIHALELWFDHRFGDTAVLLSRVAVVKPITLKVELQSVWNGPDPNIVVGGQRYGEGAVLPDGSVVQQITDHTVSLLRDGQPYSLEY